jgi:TolB-like protein/class 3 adenylate cyclase
MATQDFKRKLTAIFSADVKGYSRLMGEDELATIETLKKYREIVVKLIQEQRGRVVDSPGDNVMAEFASVVDALQCAVDIQKQLKLRNDELPENRRMEFRIGVNLGDVIEDGERIYGDGVNIAARVESLAHGGGICISGTAFDQIGKKLALGYEYLGEQAVKNIEKPVRVYRVLMEPEAVGKVIGEKKVEPKRGQRVAIAVVIAFLLVAGGLVLWKSFLPTAPSQEPDKPSIAVLPFDNMSEDPKQEYFADGMSDDLITDLSKISGLLVIARNSSFTYKGKAVKVPQIAQELGVRYVLEGSVRRVGNEVRINAQLIDSTTGGHLWAERYDGRMDDIFALQDKITGQIVNALAVKLTTDEEKRFELKETISIEAYDAFLQGWEHYLRQTPDDFVKALSYFKKALELDPNYGRAYAALSLTYWNGASLGWAKRIGVSSYILARIRARHYLDIAMKNPTSIAHLVKFWMVYYRRNYQEAFTQARRVIALDPNNAEGYLVLARILTMTGRPQESIDFVEKAMKLDPRNIVGPLGHLGRAHFSMGQYEEAVAVYERALKLNPKRTGFGGTLAAAYAHLGRDQEARDALDIYRKGWGRLAPNLNLQLVMYFSPYKNAEDADRFADGLLKAGLPGKPSGYYKVSEGNKLTGEEIRSLFFGHSSYGIYRKKQWLMDRTKDGEATYRFGSKLLGIGKSWVEGDELCNQWQEKKLYDGLKYCMNVFRNPEGIPEEKNDYFLVTDWRIFPSSLKN